MIRTTKSVITINVWSHENMCKKVMCIMQERWFDSKNILKHIWILLHIFRMSNNKNVRKYK